MEKKKKTVLALFFFPRVSTFFCFFRQRGIFPSGVCTPSHHPEIGRFPTPSKTQSSFFLPFVDGSIPDVLLPLSLFLKIS